MNTELIVLSNIVIMFFVLAFAGYAHKNQLDFQSQLLLSFKDKESLGEDESSTVVEKVEDKLTPEEQNEFDFEASFDALSADLEVNEKKVEVLEAKVKSLESFISKLENSLKNIRDYVESNTSPSHLELTEELEEELSNKNYLSETTNDSIDNIFDEINKEKP